MANTLTLTVDVKFLQTGQTIPIQLMRESGKTVSVTSNLLAGGVQNIGTSAEAIAVGEITTEGYAVFKNMDATNYVEIGWDSSGFVSALKLLAGQIAVCPLNGAQTWQARANTAAVDLYYMICGV